jgi:hypothetical protein
MAGGIVGGVGGKIAEGEVPALRFGAADWLHGDVIEKRPAARR